MNRPSGSQETADAVNKATVRDCTSIALPFVLIAICLAGLDFYVLVLEGQSEWLMTAWVAVIPLIAAYLLYRNMPGSWPVALGTRTGLFVHLYIHYYFSLWWVVSSGWAVSGFIDKAIGAGSAVGIILGSISAAVHLRLSRQVTETWETGNGPNEVEMIVIPRLPSWAVLLTLIGLQALAYLAGLRLGGRWLIF